MAGKPKDMTGQVIGELKVDSYAGEGYWNCTCSCGVQKKIRGYELRTGKITSCGHDKTKSNEFIDLTGKKFGEWTPLKYVGKGNWLCRCSCGKELVVGGWELRHETSKSCGHFVPDLKPGDKFNDWTVIEYVGSGKYRCICSCGKEGLILKNHLVNGISKSCGHNKIKDLTGQRFGEWLVISRAPNYKYTCKCSCGTVRDVFESNLLNGTSKSCGCKSNELFKNTMTDKYGVSSYAKLNRSDEQLKMIETKENFEYYLNKLAIDLNRIPIVVEVSEMLGINETNTLKYIHKYNAENLVNLGWSWKSSYETEIMEMFPGGEQSNRSVLGNGEIDILYRDKGIGIEFNGNYWHSSIFVDRLYHKNKSLRALEKGVRIIHVFEYEWNDDIKREKIINIINNALGNYKYTIYARDCTISKVDTKSTEIKDFINKYHLQGYTNSQVGYGCYYKGELIGVMTFGAPRFNNECEWELIRLVWNFDYKVIGGTERLFKHFISEFNPSSIISYCNVAKFSGNIYKNLGFKNEGVTNPNYVWYNNHSNLVLQRYETTLEKLKKAGYGNIGDSEEEIMENLGYIRIYDSGNFKFIWRNLNG
ncbi:MAG: hypothetical protein IJ593_02225 [Lachnospiraceae bacterium]|nr:hypothetical protein [Lachnospiraceae bacterium]